MIVIMCVCQNMDVTLFCDPFMKMSIYSYICYYLFIMVYLFIHLMLASPSEKLAIHLIGFMLMWKMEHWMEKHSCICRLQPPRVFILNSQCSLFMIWDYSMKLARWFPVFKNWRKVWHWSRSSAAAVSTGTSVHTTVNEQLGVDLIR